MKFFFLIFCCLCLTFPLKAQEYLDQAICFTIKNSADYRVFGEIRTAEDVYQGFEGRFEGDRVHHSATFRLQPDEDIPVCTTGPLYPGNKVRLMLRTLVPVFECLTMIYPGLEITINGRRRADDSGVETWAECL